MTVGEKLKNARMDAGFTQEELANKMMVSRSAIAKWENNRGIPDVNNLKVLAEALGVTVDYLLDDGSALDLTVTKKAIDLTKYGDQGRLSRIRKVQIKEKIICEEYPDQEILGLTLTGIKNTKNETIADMFIGWLALIFGGIPLFGTQEFGKTLNSLDQQYYLVNDGKKQYFVLLTDEQMITRVMANPITQKKFEVGDKKLMVTGTNGKKIALS